MNKYSKITASLAIASAIVLAGCSTTSTTTKTTPKKQSNKNLVHGFAAAMTGSGEVPPVKTDATGGAAFIIAANGKSIQYNLSVNNIKNVIAAHLHLASANKKGPVVVKLYPTKTNKGFGSGTGVLSNGTITSKDLVGPLKGKTIADLIKDMRAGKIYVNVHTKAHKPGEIRGKLRGAVSTH